MRPLALLACALLATGAARASSLKDEVSATASQATAQNPRSGSVSNLLDASFDAGERWTVSAGGQITWEVPAPAPAGDPAAFRDRGGTVADLHAGLDWDVTDNWTLGTTVGFSPRTTTAASAKLALSGGDTESLVRATNSSASLDLVAGYDTAGDSNLEWSFTGGVTLSRFETQQRIAALEYNGSAVTAAQFRNLCPSTNVRCRPILRALDANSDVLRWARFSGGVTATIFVDTDLTLDGDYYGYADDPAAVGFFSVGSTNRVSGGSGVAIAPLHYLIRPEVVHRFGDFSLKLWLQGGRYMPRTGQTTAGAGLKAQYKFTRSFRMWASLAGQNDVDPSGEASQSSTVALGAGYRF